MNAAPKILVIEDNSTMRKMMRVALEGAGFTPLEAPDGRTALKLIAEQAPDAVVEDLVLPDIDGVELVRRMRETPNGAEVPVIACSGFLSKLDEARTLDVGFSGYLFKPVEPSRLIAALRGYLPEGTLAGERPGRGRRVLVVDDDIIQSKLLAIRLGQLDVDVTISSSATEALELARRRFFDAIVSNALMPKVDGFELCRRVRQDPRLVATPVVLVSANYADEADRRLSELVGASALVACMPSQREVVEALLASFERTPEPARQGPGAAAEPAHRAVRQLERQLAHSQGLAQTAALQATQLSVIAGVFEVLIRELDVELVLTEILARYLEASSAFSGALAYLVEEDHGYVLRARQGFQGVADDALPRFFGHLELLERAAKSGEMRSIPWSDPPPADMVDLLKKSGARSLLITPLQYGGAVLGAIVLGVGTHMLDPDWLGFAKAVGSQIAQGVALAQSLDRRAAAESRFRDLVETLDAIVWEADETRREYGFVSRQAEEVLGYAPAQWLSEPDFWINHVEPEDRAAALQAHRAALAGSGDAFEYRAIAADGRTLWLNDSVRPTRDKQGRLRARGVTIDVTSRRQLERQLLHAQKMEAIGRLAGGVAHDFNNILTFILGRCDFAAMRLDEGHPARADVDHIRRASERATAITRQLLAFTRTEEPAPRSINLNECLADLGKMLTHVLDDPIELVMSLTAPRPHICADPAQIDQIVLNLAVNARDAMPRGGRLSIETANVEIDSAQASHPSDLKPGSYVVLSVSDTGTGMDAETRAHVFDPYFTTKDVGHGSGLGLATVYGAVKRAAGAISLISEPSSGTLFRIYLPCAKEAHEEREPPEAPPMPHGAETVLFVEDDADLRVIGRELLTLQGYGVLLAADGVEATEVADQHPGSIDLLVTDLLMPRMGGQELAERLRLSRPAMKVLFTSGYTGHSVFEHATLGAAASYLQKPYNLDELARGIRALLDERPSETQRRPA